MIESKLQSIKNNSVIKLIAYIMANSPAIAQDIISPYIISILNTKISNVNVISTSASSCPLLDWLTTRTGKQVPVRQNKVLLN